jgi:hypothetical protein
MSRVIKLDGFDNTEVNFPNRLQDGSVNPVNPTWFGYSLNTGPSGATSFTGYVYGNGISPATGDRLTYVNSSGAVGSLILNQVANIANDGATLKTFSATGNVSTTIPFLPLYTIFIGQRPGESVGFDKFIEVLTGSTGSTYNTMAYTDINTGDNLLYLNPEGTSGSTTITNLSYDGSIAGFNLYKTTFSPNPGAITGSIVYRSQGPPVPLNRVISRRNRSKFQTSE